MVDRSWIGGNVFYLGINSNIVIFFNNIMGICEKFGFWF